MSILLLVFSTFFLNILTLPEAISRANLSSYELQIREQEIKIKEGEVLQASLLPNPALDVAYDGFWGKGPYCGHQNAVTTYELQTLWELGGKRGERTLLARMDKLLSEWNFEEAKTALLTDLKIDFIDAYIAQEKLRIERDYLKIAGQAFDASNEMMQRGKETKSHFSRAKLKFIQSSVEVERQERQFSMKKSKLSSYWNEECPDFECLYFDLECLPPIADLCTYEMKLMNYPGLVRQKLLVNRAEREVELQKAYAYPDVLLSLGVDHEVRRGNYGMKVEVNLPLPIFNSNQGKIFSARQQVIQADLQAKDYHLDLVLQVRKIYRQLELIQEELSIYQQEILPSLYETHEGALEAYHEGKMELLHFMENEQFFLETKMTFLDTLAAFHKFYIELCQYIRSIP